MSDLPLGPSPCCFWVGKQVAFETWPLFHLSQGPKSIWVWDHISFRLGISWGQNCLVLGPKLFWVWDVIVFSLGTELDLDPRLNAIWVHERFASGSRPLLLLGRKTSCIWDLTLLPFDLGTKSLFGWGLVRDRIAFGYGIEVILGIGPIIFGSYFIYDYNIWVRDKITLW